MGGLRDAFHTCHTSDITRADSMQSRRRSFFNLVSPEQITEHSLEVWRALPAEIRHDPSMASFQQENERLGVPRDDASTTRLSVNSTHEDAISASGSEYINMRNLQSKTELNNSTKESGINCKNDEQPISNDEQNDETMNSYQQSFKKICLMIFWLLTAAALIFRGEKKLMEKTLAVPAAAEKLYRLPQSPLGDFKLKVFGAFDESLECSNETENWLTLQLELVQENVANITVESIQNISQPWKIPLVAERDLDLAPIISTNRTFRMPAATLTLLNEERVTVRLQIYAHNTTSEVTIKLIYDPLIVNVRTGTILAALILCVFYALLVWEVFHRTFIAIVCSMAAIAVLAALNDRPSMDEIVVWMDMEMLTLMFAMMLLIGIMTETGVFDYVAVLCFELSGGNIWPLIYSLCMITCLVSSFLDNMTTVFLMTPVAIRLCEVMNLDPVPVVMGIIVHANIGGALTPIGDPISIIICTNYFIDKAGVTFLEFMSHTITGVILTVIQSCVYLRLVFWDTKSLRVNESNDIRELRREIMIWQRTANNMPALSKDVELVRATLFKKVKILKYKLKRKQIGVGSEDAYVNTLEDLKLNYPIKNKVLLAQSVTALVFIIICFFVQSVPSLRTLPLGWVALLGVIGLLIVLNREDMEHMLQRMEWTTLLFFGAMFVMMECVERLGLIGWIGEITEHIILMVSGRYRLAAAIVIILWFSAFASAILDSIPVAAMMVKLVVSLVAKESLGLPLQPLVWALVFGSTLGGNGTLYGASSNVLSAGIAEQHGYKISFNRYLKIVFPMMLGQIVVITLYLMTAHIIFEWH